MYIHTDFSDRTVFIVLIRQTKMTSTNKISISDNNYSINDSTVGIVRMHRNDYQLRRISGRIRKLSIIYVNALPHESSEVRASATT